MHVKMKRISPQSPMFLSIIALSLLTSKHVFSAPVDDDTKTATTISSDTLGIATATPSNFYSALYVSSSNQSCSALPKFEDESFISLKINSMCNKVNASSTFSPNKRLCRALSSLFPKLCELSNNTSPNVNKVTNKISEDETVAGELDPVCTKLAKFVRRFGLRKEPLTLPWKGYSYPSALKNLTRKCRADCKNIPMPEIRGDKNQYINPACLLLLRGYEIYNGITLTLTQSHATSAESTLSPPTHTSKEMQDEELKPRPKIKRKLKTEDQEEKSKNSNDEPDIAVIPRHQKTKKNAALQGESSSLLNSKVDKNKTATQDQDTENQDGTQPQTVNAKSSITVDQLNLANSDDKNKKSASLGNSSARVRGREGVTESSDTSFFKTSENVSNTTVSESAKNKSATIEDSKSQTVEKAATMSDTKVDDDDDDDKAVNNKTIVSQVKSSSQVSDDAVGGSEGKVSDKLSVGSTKDENVSKSSTTSTTAASIDAGNGPRDLPLPISAVDDDLIKKKTSTASPSSDNTNEKKSPAKLDGLDTDVESSSEDKKKVKPQGPPKKVNSVSANNDDDVDKKDQIQKPISGNKNTNSEKVEVLDENQAVDDYNGLEVDDDDGERKQEKVGGKTSIKKDDEEDDDVAEDESPKEPKNKGRGKNKNSYGEAVQYENRGTTINVSLNESEESGFFGYFMFSVIVFGALYLLVHNKKRLIAYVVEGRRPRSRSRRASSSSSQYRRLENNFD